MNRASRPWDAAHPVQPEALRVACPNQRTNLKFLLVLHTFLEPREELVVPGVVKKTLSGFNGKKVLEVDVGVVKQRVTASAAEDLFAVRMMFGVMCNPPVRGKGSAPAGTAEYPLIQLGAESAY